jgi:kynureninase
MTGFCLEMIDDLLSSKGLEFSIATPRRESRRGGHLAVIHPEGMRIASALRARGIIPDFRPPDIIRVAPVALFNTFTEIWELIRHLGEIIANREYERFPEERGAIT